MSYADKYLSKQIAFIPYIERPPSGLLYFCVVIPTYLEDKIINTLISLKNAQPPEINVEILIVVNYSISESELNKSANNETYHELLLWCKSNSTETLRFFALLAADLPYKHAGVGLARKIGMDIALQRFNQLNRPEGIILSLDADSTVHPYYFKAVEEKLFASVSNNYGGFIFQFEHPTSGDEFNIDVYDAIVHYELHLRYYRHILQYTGFPYSYYTIGSCFGVNALFYAEQGGMNRRQAGEDFYFLNKLFPHKPFAFLNNSCVYPSPRPSFRVPFGTGAAVSRIVSNREHNYQSYSPQAFIDLKYLFNSIEKIYQNPAQDCNLIFQTFPVSLQNFLLQSEFQNKIDEIRKNTKTIEAFQKRFYIWFDGFRVVKYLNWSHQYFYKKIPVDIAVKEYMEICGITFNFKNAIEILQYFREQDRNKNDQ
jgi:hypothetical protein